MAEKKNYPSRTAEYQRAKENERRAALGLKPVKPQLRFRDWSEYTPLVTAFTTALKEDLALVADLAEGELS